MTARLDPTGSDGPEAALPPGAPGDDPLAFFQQEPQEVVKGSDDSGAPRIDAIPSQAPSEPIATPRVDDGKPPTPGVLNRIKGVLRALDIARDFEKTVDARLAALRGLDQEVQDRAGRLERLNQEISVGAAHADDVLRALALARDAEKTVDNRLAVLRGLDQEMQDRAGRLERLNQEIGVGGAHADEVLRALEIARDFEKTVDNRLAALRDLDQEVQERAGRLERINQEIRAGGAHADEVLRALEIARDFEKTVDTRLAALRDLDQEVQDRAGRLERLNKEISVGAAHADDVLRAIGSLEQPLADLQRHKQDLPAIETAIAAFEKRAQAVSASLAGYVTDCEARARIAEETVTRLYDVSSRTLPALQERTKEAEEQHQSLERLVTEAARIAASLTALQERLPAVGQCDHDLARIELAVPQIARQLDDLNASAEQQIKALAVHQQRVRHTLDESQKTAAVVSELAGRIVELTGSHQQLDRLETSVTHLEQRTAAAVGEVRHATRAKDELQRQIENCQQQIERLTTAAQGQAETLKKLRRQAKGHGGDYALSRLAHDLFSTLRFRRPDISRGLSPARLRFGGVVFAFSAAILLLVGLVWRISPVERQSREQALAAPVEAGRALTSAPAAGVVPVAADIGDDRREATRTAPAPPAVAVPVAVVSTTPAATRGVPAATVRELSVRKDETTPRFVGTLLIESDPAGAAAFVNQRPVGRTPVLLKALRAGSYVVRLEYDGYQRWSTAATVSAVRQERVRAKLERERNR